MRRYNIGRGEERTALYDDGAGECDDWDAEEDRGGQADGFGA